ncbi:MAG: DNA alkylation repair protein [Terriglobales bacterium]
MKSRIRNPKSQIAVSKSPKYIADHVRRLLKDGGSAPHAAEVQRFFKEEVQSRGWYTAELRKVAGRVRRAVLRDAGLKFLIEVADDLFSGEVLEEKVFAVFLLEKSVGEFGERELKRFERWLERVSSWADHDALVHYLIAPMLVNDDYLVRRIYRWANSPNRWLRRASAVALIRGVRAGRFHQDVECLADLILCDPDDMVRKGYGWLLREATKADAKAMLPFLMSIRETAPRLVLRTACETLPKELRAKVLGWPLVIFEF